MPSPLGSLFSTIDSAKRKVIDALMNPGAMLENLVAEKNTDAGAHLDDLRHMPMPGQFPQPGGNAAKERVLTALAEGYNPGGIFVGARAKGIDNIALAYAMKDARKGAKPEEIWQERGWAKAPWDGLWRHEIPDAHVGPVLHERVDKNTLHYVYPSKINETAPQARAVESFPFPELYKAYPALGTNYMHLTADPRIQANSGSYMRGSENFGYRSGQIKGSGPDYFGVRETALHELQHGVQLLEGWQGGGSPAMFKTNDPAQALRFYQRLAGEAEARLTENRAYYTPTERKARFPYDPDNFWADTSVPLDKLIVP